MTKKLVSLFMLAVFFLYTITPAIAFPGRPQIETHKATFSFEKADPSFPELPSEVTNQLINKEKTGLKKGDTFNQDTIIQGLGITTNQINKIGTDAWTWTFKEWTTTGLTPEGNIGTEDITVVGTWNFVATQIDVPGPGVPGDHDKNPANPEPKKSYSWGGGGHQSLRIIVQMVIIVQATMMEAVDKKKKRKLKMRKKLKKIRKQKMKIRK